MTLEKSMQTLDLSGADAFLKRKVCIVGAGVAGLKAAVDLATSKMVALDEIIVLEAQDRIGGRIKTDRSSSKIGNHYDLGGAWFHDALTNITLAEGEAKGQLSFEAGDVYFDDRDVFHVDSQSEPGKALDMISSKCLRVYEELCKFIETHFHDSLDTADVSLETITMEYFKKYSRRITETQKEVVSRWIRHYELWYGISWDSISGRYSMMDHEGRNGYNVKGYDYLINELIAQLPGVVAINAPVTKINREQNFIVTTPSASIVCDYLVVTVPLSVLQKPAGARGAIEWQPALPSPITDALSTIHFGALGKVIFEFKEAFWDTEQDRFEILADENVPLPSKSLSNTPKPFTYPAHIVNYAAKGKRYNNGPALVVLTQDPLTQWTESHPEQVWEYFGPMLAKLEAPGKHWQKPVNTIVTDWTTNPYFGGSYAAVKTGDDPSALIVQLCGDYEGVGMGPQIQFAGEHTIVDGAGCIHGAYMSGARAATAIVKAMS
ncbi:corticosteroid-binding protein [Diutina catenulata]